MSAPLSLFFNATVRPLKHDRCFQGKPDGFSGLSWWFPSHSYHIKSSLSNTRTTCMTVSHCPCQRPGPVGCELRPRGWRLCDESWMSPQDGQ
jgi:hypothetical protein